jgi:hypothetical protein
MERKRRGYSEKLIVTGENMKKAPDWKTTLHIFSQKVIAFGFICLVQKTIGSHNTMWNWSEGIC